MSKKKAINVYSLIRGKNLDEIREVFDDMPEIFGERLKVGKCLYPIEEAIKNESYDVFEFLLHRLPIDNVGKSINKIVYYLEKNNKTTNGYVYKSYSTVKPEDIKIYYFQLRDRLNGHLEYLKEYFLELIGVKDRDFTMEKLEEVVNGIIPSINKNMYALMAEDKTWKISVESQIMRFCSNDRLKEWMIIFTRNGINHNGLVAYQLINNSDRLKKGVKLDYYEKIVISDYNRSYGYGLSTPSVNIPPVSLLSLLLFYNKREFMDKTSEKMLIKNITEEMKDNIMMDIKNLIEYDKDVLSFSRSLGDGLVLFTNYNKYIKNNYSYYWSTKTTEFIYGSGRDKLKKYFEWMASYVRIGELCDMLDFGIENIEYKKLLEEIKELDNPKIPEKATIEEK
jgi:hypothetical protein